MSIIDIQPAPAHVEDAYTGQDHGYIVTAEWDVAYRRAYWNEDAVKAAVGKDKSRHVYRAEKALVACIRSGGFPHYEIVDDVAVLVYQ